MARARLSVRGGTPRDVPSVVSTRLGAGLRREWLLTRPTGAPLTRLVRAR